MAKTKDSVSKKHPFSTLEDWRYFCRHRKLNPEARRHQSLMDDLKHNMQSRKKNVLYDLEEKELEQLRSLLQKLYRTF